MPEEEKKKVARVERTREGEKAPEVPKEAPKVVTPEKAPLREKPGTAPPAAPKPPAAPAVAKDPVLKEVESILEENLDKVYAELPPELRPKFKLKGEEVAAAIHDMVSQAKVKAKKVLKLIVGWLKIIPGVNRFFLEQEAAIKTQKIIAMVEKNKK